jgi:hypothetical protein
LVCQTTDRFEQTTFFDDHMSTHDGTRPNMCTNEKPRYFQNAGLEAIDGRRPKPKETRRSQLQKQKVLFQHNGSMMNPVRDLGANTSF